MQFFYALTLLVSATLLFVVQPMFARLVLPKLGGSPAVWNTCMVFYQAALLLGYLYAHLAVRWLGARRQAVVHLAVMCLPWLVLPVAVTAAPPTASNPIPWLLGQMALTVGLPFLVVSASAPMVQAWFAETGHPAGKDPYFLYAASNLGSMAALLGYPIVVEPLLRLNAQTHAWAAGYGTLMLLIGGCAVFLWRSRPSSPLPSTGEGPGVRAGSERSGIGDWGLEAGHQTSPLPLAGEGPGVRALDPAATPSTAPTWRTRLLWIALALVPSSLLLGVTNFITTDIAAVPLLWVLPLALYLLTFVIVFSQWWTRASEPKEASPDAAADARRGWPQRAVLWLQPILLTLLAMILFAQAGRWMGWAILLHLAAFFITALACHSELARRRPAAAWLTEFYLWMSLGGVLGGLFNAMLAPLIFPVILEYPLALVAACLLRPQPPTGGNRRRAWVMDLVVPAVLAGALAALTWALENRGDLVSWLDDQAVKFIVLGLGAVGAFSVQKRPLRFALAVAAVLAFGGLWFERWANVLHTERGFFGVLRVRSDSDGIEHSLVHGSTNHGMQYLDDRREEPQTYYHRHGPLGQAIKGLCPVAKPGEVPRRLGVVGLGTGTTAAYGAAGRWLTYFEIDPSVVRIAQDSKFFTYIADCRLRAGVRSVRIELGDARLTLADEPDGHFDLLAIDAFSSDSIPIHLITREALEMYVQKLAPHGVLMIHISNRHLDLSPVLGNLAEDGGWACLERSDEGLTDEQKNDRQWQGRYASTWVALARAPADLGLLTRDDRWKPLPTDPRIGLWTDDYSNIVAVLNWFRRKK